MNAPNKAITNLRPDLAMLFQEWNLEMSLRGFIAQQVLPVRDVLDQRGTLPHIPLEQLLKTAESRRASNGDYSRVNFTFGDKTYTCKEHGIEVPVDDRNSRMYRNFFEMEKVAAALAFLTVLTNAEKRAATAIFNTTTWTGAGLTTAITNEWDDLVNATPVDDVAAAKQKIWDNSGLEANALIIGRSVWENLRRVKQIKDDVASAGAGSSQMLMNVTKEMVARALGLDMIFVGGAPKNNANEAKTRSLAQIWDKEYAMVCRVVTNPGLSEIDPGLGITAHWSEDGSAIGGMFESYRDEPKRADVVRVRQEVDELILYKEAGHLLSNITT